MAMPITHIAIADKIQSKYLADKDRREFFIGTSLPDIRYIAGIPRNTTHFEEKTFEDIRKADSYTAGFYFHAYVDYRRRTFLSENGIDNFIEPDIFNSYAIKMLEDYLFYDMVSDWDNIVGYFDNILDKEKDIPVSLKIIKDYHLQLQNYFKEKPNYDTFIKLMRSLGYDNKKAVDIVSRFDQVRVNENIVNLVLGMYESIIAKV